MQSGVVLSVFILLLCVDNALAACGAGPIVGAIFGTIAVCCVIFGLIFFLCLKKGVIKKGKVFLIFPPPCSVNIFLQNVLIARAHITCNKSYRWHSAFSTSLRLPSFSFDLKFIFLNFGVHLTK